MHTVLFINIFFDHVVFHKKTSIYFVRMKAGPFLKSTASLHSELIQSTAIVLKKFHTLHNTEKKICHYSAFVIFQLYCSIHSY